MQSFDYADDKLDAMKFGWTKEKLGRKSQALSALAPLARGSASGVIVEIILGWVDAK